MLQSDEPREWPTVSSDEESLVLADMPARSLSFYVSSWLVRFLVWMER